MSATTLKIGRGESWSYLQQDGEEGIGRKTYCRVYGSGFKVKGPKIL